MKFEGPPALPHGLFPSKTPNIVHSSPGIPLTCSLFYWDTVSSSFYLFIYLFWRDWFIISKKKKKHLSIFSIKTITLLRFLSPNQPPKRPHQREYILSQLSYKLQTYKVNNTTKEQVSEGRHTRSCLSWKTLYM